MPLVVIQKGGSKLETKIISNRDWQTCQTVLRWKELLIWDRVKNYVYNRKLLQEKRMDLKPTNKNKKKAKARKKLFDW